MKQQTIFLIVLLLFICVMVMVLFKYAATPVSELPTWVYWLIK